MKSKQAKAKLQSTKSYLKPPFSFSWPQSSKSAETAVIRLLRDLVVKLGLARPLTAKEQRRAEEKKLGRRLEKRAKGTISDADWSEELLHMELDRTGSSAEIPEDPTGEGTPTPAPIRPEDAPRCSGVDRPSVTPLSSNTANNWPIREASYGLIIGYQNVVKTLQAAQPITDRHPILCAIFDRAILKPSPRDYFTALAARVPFGAGLTWVGAVEGLNDGIADVVGVHSVMAIGIKKTAFPESTQFLDLVDLVKQSLNPLELSENLTFHLPICPRDSEGSGATGGTAAGNPVAFESSVPVETREAGLKRKLMEEEVEEADSSSGELDKKLDSAGVFVKAEVVCYPKKPKK